MVQNLDPHIRKFLLYTISETFAEIRKFVEFKQYDREKVKNGILELCAALNLDLSEEQTKELKQPIINESVFFTCQKCGRPKSRKERIHFPYHFKCEELIRRENHRIFKRKK